MSPRARSLLLNFLRIGISAALLAWVLSQTGVQRLAQALQDADPRPYLLALLIGLAGILIRAWRWKILLAAVGARLPFRRVAYLYFTGAFFNAFLPTGFGGDVVRVLEVGADVDTARAAGTIVVDRLTGFIVLFGLALAALPFARDLLPPAITSLIALLGLGLLAGSALLFEGRLLRGLAGRLPRLLGRPLPALGWAARLAATIAACGRGPLLGALGVSLLFNLSLLAAACLIAAALHIVISPAALFTFVPVATATLLLPISIGGLGVREGVYVTLFAQVGVGEAQALAFSLAYYSLDLTAGLAGGLIYLASGLVRLRSGQ